MKFYRPKGQEHKLDQTMLIREDGRVERLCEHGVGHPVGHVKPNGWDDKWMGVHGCCGCCYKVWFWRGIEWEEHGEGNQVSEGSDSKD